MALFILFQLSGCATHETLHYDERPYHERVEVFESHGLRTEAAALSAEESRELFTAPLNNIGIQPVWLKVTNTTDHDHWFFPISVDNDYFPAYEVASRAENTGLQHRHEIHKLLEKNQMPQLIPANSTVSGFVYTHSDEGMKAFGIEMHSPHQTVHHTFVTPVPGLPVDYFDLVPDEIYAHSDIQDLQLEELRTWIKEVFCCTLNHESKVGDPVNIVFVGNLDQVRRALISRHWDVTAPVTGASLMRMVQAFIFGSRYRYAPISKLYLFEREHDLAFQKARAIIDERNHMRLWLAPVSYQSREVWFGQISRDVDVKLSGRLWPPTTHVIDPDIDDARFYLLQDLIEGEALHTLAYVRSHEKASADKPHYNAEDDPYFTDGLRAVFFLADSPTSANDLKILKWDLPEKISHYLPPTE